jgi:hypothetical protein
VRKKQRHSAHCLINAPHEQPIKTQGMGVAKDGWYTELGPLWPGQGLSLKVKEVLYEGRSDFQVRCRLCA